MSGRRFIVSLFIATCLSEYLCSYTLYSIRYGDENIILLLELTEPQINCLIIVIIHYSYAVQSYPAPSSIE